MVTEKRPKLIRDWPSPFRETIPAGAIGWHDSDEWSPRWLFGLSGQPYLEGVRDPSEWPDWFTWVDWCLTCELEVCEHDVIMRLAPNDVTHHLPSSHNPCGYHVVHCGLCHGHADKCETCGKAVCVEGPLNCSLCACFSVSALNGLCHGHNEPKTLTWGSALNRWTIRVNPNGMYVHDDKQDVWLAKDGAEHSRLPVDADSCVFPSPTVLLRAVELNRDAANHGEPKPEPVVCNVEYCGICHPDPTREETKPPTPEPKPFMTVTDAPTPRPELTCLSACGECDALGPHRMLDFEVDQLRRLDDGSIACPECGNSVEAYSAYACCISDNACGTFKEPTPLYPVRDLYAPFFIVNGNGDVQGFTRGYGSGLSGYTRWRTRGEHAEQAAKAHAKLDKVLQNAFNVAAGFPRRTSDVGPVPIHRVGEWPNNAMTGDEADLLNLIHDAKRGGGE